MAQEALSKLVAHHFIQLLTNRLSFSLFFKKKRNHMNFMDKLKTNNKSNELSPFGVSFENVCSVPHSCSFGLFNKKHNNLN